MISHEIIECDQCKTSSAKNTNLNKAVKTIEPLEGVFVNLCKQCLGEWFES